MVYEMDMAGVLNSMPDEDLVATCKRLQRSVEDMTTLFNEFEQEQEMLLREQDRLHSRIEKVLKGENKKKQEGGMFSSFLNQVDKQLEVSNIFKAKAQRQAARRRHTPVKLDPVDYQEDDEQENGPFSEANLQKSWAGYVILGALRQDPNTADILEMVRWVREALCAESVAEADSVDMWMAKAQLVTACVAMDDPDSMRPVGATNSLRNSLAVGQSITSIPEASDDDKFGESDVDEDVVPQDREPRLSSRPEGDKRTSFSGFLSGLVADFAGTGNSTTPEVFSLTVVLRRKSAKEKWGLAWRDEEMKESGARVFRYAVQDSVADVWNAQKKEDGDPDQCIQPMDRLFSVNGKKNPDEIKAELTGQGLEVVLEFHRIVGPAVTLNSATNDIGDNVTAGTSIPVGANVNAEVSQLALALRNYEKANELPEGSATAEQLRNSSIGIEGWAAAADRQACVKAPRSPARQKPSFSKAFSAYLEGQGLSIQTPQSKLEIASAPIAETPSESRPDPDEVLEVQARNKLPAKLVELDMTDTVEEVSSPRPLRNTPHSIVVQVLSLIAGAVRLSWSFDWSVAPGDLQNEPWVARGFEVFEVEDGKAQGAGKSWMTTKPFVKLELPVGHHYTVKVRALILDTRTCSASSIALASDANDNRYSDSSLAASAESSVASEAAWLSDSSLSAMVDLRSTSSMSPEKRQESRGEVSDGGDTCEKFVMRTSVTTKRSTVASGLGSFLAQTPLSPSRTPSSPSAKTARPELRKTVSMPVGNSTVVDVDNLGSPNPLNSSAPRVVANFSMSAADEKQEIAERLRIRRGGPLVAVDATMTTARSSSIDDDDGSLQQLASALRSLQNSASTKWETIAEEGHHQLHDRLDSSSPVKPKGDSPDPEPSSTRFQLVVHLNDGKVETIEFSNHTDTLELMREFVLRHRLREDLLLQPLNERAEIMVRSSRLEDVVDIIDLL